jgi:hypothetical protein
MNLLCCCMFINWICAAGMTQQQYCRTVQFSVELQWVCKRCLQTMRQGRDVGHAYNYGAGLLRLKCSAPQFLLAVGKEIEQLPPVNPQFYEHCPVSDYRYERDIYSSSLLEMCPGLDKRFAAARVKADGSCLFNSVSLLLTSKFLRLVYLVYSIFTLLIEPYDNSPRLLH